MGSTNEYHDKEDNMIDDGYESPSKTVLKLNTRSRIILLHIQMNEWKNRCLQKISDGKALVEPLLEEFHTKLKKYDV